MRWAKHVAQMWAKREIRIGYWRESQKEEDRYEE
jgi:hypothetical protein